MFALVVPELGNLLRVAGEAGICDIARKGNVQRRMGILVATEAAFDLEMRFPHMALGTLWYWFLHRRRVTDVAAAASDARVLSAGGCYISRRSGMTLYTVIICHRGLFLGGQCA
jgi:hypothetical protein